MGTQKQRIEELERRVRELEARPVFIPVPMPTPQPYCNPLPVPMPTPQPYRNPPSIPSFPSLQPNIEPRVTTCQHNGTNT
jgi:hypothetical protein